MRILVVGGGGREHALAWKLAASSRVETVYVAPGNAGTAREARVENLPLAMDDIEALLKEARARHIDLTVIGPEAPLVEGIVDRFEAAGLRCFGPRSGPAQLEGSKAFTKAFLERHGIPTADYCTFTDPAQARSWIRDHGPPVVLKADGLAAGKGVIIARTEAEAFAGVEQILEARCFGTAGNRLVVEEFLEGEEVSFICVVAGTEVLPLATSQDHKARDAGDRGPNTGGMGAYSPAPVVTDALHRRIMSEVIQPTVRGLATEDIPYSGFLYAGLMIDRAGTPKVLEYNCRLGDPETQPILMRLRSDLVDLCEAALDRRLANYAVDWDSRAALGVVMAAGGYPDNYLKGDEILGLEAVDSGVVKVFHAGTALRESSVRTNGGRVLCVTALGDTVALAQHEAYAALSKIHWRGAYWRPDIGYRAVDRPPESIA